MGVSSLKVLSVEPLVEEHCRQDRKVAKASASSKVEFCRELEMITNDKWAVKIIQE